MNTTTPNVEGNGMIHYILVPLFFIAIIGFSAAGVLYISKKIRIERLRHRLVPVYTYDPMEEVQEMEREVLLRRENTEEMQAWAGFYQHQHPLLMKNGSAREAGNVWNHSVVVVHKDHTHFS